jgi:hypothetical protein
MSNLKAAGAGIAARQGRASEKESAKDVASEKRKAFVCFASIAGRLPAHTAKGFAIFRPRR